MRELKELQPLNTLSPIDWRLEGKVREVKELQYSNAQFSIDWRLEGKVRELKELQPPNAQNPIDWRLEGKVREVKDLQRLNAQSQITRVPFRTVYSVSVLFPFNNLFPSLLYITPNSSFTPSAKSSSVTLVESTSSSTNSGYFKFSKRKDTLLRPSSLWASRKRA